MFTAYTPLDRCLGREVQVRAGGETYKGMLSGIYEFGGQSILVITPPNESGAELHIPLSGAVVRLRSEG